ncbi:hypothetical protein [Metamycoplasma hominis]|uniref:hypothetical protein n=1 Tax=Metamycoplasma hominis TaxID=2098 RepID=UPI002411912B|nr:hypothetical protein [Metamycoplasma hominis]
MWLLSSCFSLDIFGLTLGVFATLLFESSFLSLVSSFLSCLLEHEALEITVNTVANDPKIVDRINSFFFVSYVFPLIWY